MTKCPRRGNIVELQLRLEVTAVDCVIVHTSAKSCSPQSAKEVR